MSLTCKGVYIVGAKRTPFTKLGGALRETPAGHAFAAAGRDAIATAGLPAALIDGTVIGNVHYLSQCDGGKTPRYCGLYSGVPIDRPALGVNTACGSGLQAIITGALDIMTGVSKVSLTGGTEIMSALPFLVRNARFGTTLGHSYLLEDHIQKEFLDSYTGLTLQKMAEKIAKKNRVKRAEADEFAMRSHLRWKAAQEANIFKDELTQVEATIKKKNVVVAIDDPTQSSISPDEFSQMPNIIDGASVITSGNSSMPADGAAAVLLANEAMTKQHQLKPLARVTAWATVGTDPLETGLGAIPAVKKLLEITGLKTVDVDLFEINETFASQALITARALDVSTEKVNVNGGALSMGNPVGATGARMAVHLVHELRRRNIRRGVATSSCGGGQGVAVLIESLL